MYDYNMFTSDMSCGLGMCTEFANRMGGAAASKCGDL